MTNFLRPDEMSAQSEIERATSRDKNLKRGLKTAATAGLAGAAISSKIAPFLSEFIPAELAIKGISKFNPKLGKILQKGQSIGLNMREGLDYIKENINPKNAKENRNIVEQYSPELNQYIKEHIQNGKEVLWAGAKARMDKKYEKIIEKIEKDHKTDWSAILQTVYGKEGAKNQQNPESPPMQAPGAPEKVNPQLMAILQQIQQARGGTPR